MSAIHAAKVADYGAALHALSETIGCAVVADNARAMQLASALQARGFDIRGIRPPTVPAGTARLRISPTLNADEDDVRSLLDALVEETRGWCR